MGTVRRRHSSEFKAMVALKAMKGLKTLNELASEYGVTSRAHISCIFGGVMPYHPQEAQRLCQRGGVDDKTA